MKPDWKNAPEWARFVAMDDDGEWYWYEERPECGGSAWIGRTGRFQFAGSGGVWKETLQCHPVRFYFPVRGIEGQKLPNDEPAAANAETEEGR